MADYTPILTAAHMKACDTYTIETLGIPSRELMENAARKVARFLLKHTDLFPVGKVAVLCGSGNNGGDGFAAARFLTDGSMHETRETVIVYTGRWNDHGHPDATRMSQECARQYRLAVDMGISVLPPAVLTEALDGTVAVVDAIFGIGLDRPVEGALASLLRSVAASGLPVLAVDIPSGIHADTGAVMGTALPARATVTMQALKAGHLLYPGADLCGHIRVCDLGIDLSAVPKPFAYVAENALLFRALPPRARRSHKGTYGRTVLLCGSVGMSGAAILAAKACLRSGAGLAQVVTPEDNRVVLQTALPEAIVTVYNGHTPPPGSEPMGTAQASDLRNTVREVMQTADGVVLGCGLGTSPASRMAFRAALDALPPDGHIPAVLDADALNLLAEDETLWHTPLLSSPAKRVVITPHPAEMARLCGSSVPEILSHLPRMALEFARAHGVTVVLKDAHTVIASPEGALFICAAGNAGMAKGGSGDVLAGIIGSLLTQDRARMGTDGDLTVAEVAAAGVYLHASAGDLTADELGEYGMLAGDVIDRVPFICKETSCTQTRIAH